MLYYENSNELIDLSESFSDFEILKEDVEESYQEIVLIESNFFFNEDVSTVKEKIKDIFTKIITWIKETSKKIKFSVIEQRIKLIKHDSFEINERAANIDLWLSYASDLLKYTESDNGIPENVLNRYKIFTSTQSKTKKVNKATLLKICKSIQKSFAITNRLNQLQSTLMKKAESGDFNIASNVSNLAKVITIYKNIISTAITSLNSALKGNNRSDAKGTQKGDILDKDGQSIGAYTESFLLECESDWSNIQESLVHSLLTEDMYLYNESLSETTGKMKEFFKKIFKKIKDMIFNILEKVKDLKNKFLLKVGRVTTKVGLTVRIDAHDWNHSAFSKYLEATIDFATSTLEKLNKLNNKNDSEALYNELKENNGYARFLNLKEKLSQAEFTKTVMNSFTKNKPEKQEMHFDSSKLLQYNIKLCESLDGFAAELTRLGNKFISDFEKYSEMTIKMMSSINDNEDKKEYALRAVVLKEGALTLMHAVAVGQMVSNMAYQDTVVSFNAYMAKFGKNNL